MKLVSVINNYFSQQCSKTVENLPKIEKTNKQTKIL